MPSPSPNALLDGISTTTKGMHSGTSPRLIPPDQLAFAVNITNRGGYPKTRPAIRKVAVVYPSSGVRIAATQANFQCAHGYEAFGTGEDCLIASIGGRLFRYLVGSGNAVQEISIPGDLNDSTLIQNWMWQGENLLFVNDGQALPLIFNGTGVRRSLGYPGKELPAGTMGHYIAPRNIMVMPDRRSYIAGDAVFSNNAGREAIVGIRDNLEVLAGTTFGVPLTSGRINALSSVAIPDTSLGQGPLAIGTRKGVFSAFIPLDASQWTTTQLPTMSVSLPSAGPLSQNGTVPFNADLWFRARDGFRSFSVARRDFNTWVQTPMSVEMDLILNVDSKPLLGFGSGVNFDNRFLHTASPYRVLGRGIAHRGIIALDFNNISNLTTRSNPDYDGLWTGLPVLQILVATINEQDRCFIFALDCSNNICLYEMFHTEHEFQERFDFDGHNDVLIESSIASGALWGRTLTMSQYGSLVPAGLNQPLKKLAVADTFWEHLGSLVNINVKYRSDQFPMWRDWHDFSLCAKNNVCDSGPCPSFQSVLEQYAAFQRIPEPADTPNPITGRPYRMGYEFQVRIAWTGYAQLNKFLCWAIPSSEAVPTFTKTGACKLLQGCAENYYTYKIETTCPGTEIPPTPPTPPIPPVPPGPPTPRNDPPPQYPPFTPQPVVWPLLTSLPPIPPGDPLWPPIVQVPTPTLPILNDSGNTPPDLACAVGTQFNGFQWTKDNGAKNLPVRYPSSGNQSSDPNVIFTPEQIQWWMGHVQAQFAAYISDHSHDSNPIINASMFQFYWAWGVGGETWNFERLYQSNDLGVYASAGWEIQIAYCAQVS